MALLSLCLGWSIAGSPGARSRGKATDSAEGPLFLVREAPAVYRPRRPEQAWFYRLREEHFAEFALVHEERYERTDGPLRGVVTRAVDAFLARGRQEFGFARVVCPECRAEYLVPFSCRTRNFCPSCQQKRALLFAEKLREEILAPIAHRHLIFTIPVALRGLFLRERRLLGLLPRCAYETVRRVYQELHGTREALPGMVASIQTFGSQLQWNPHVHSLVSDGVFFRGGDFVPGRLYDETIERLLTETWRRLVLDALVDEDRLSEGFRDQLLSWRGGFSVYSRHLILNEEPARLAHMARYAVRAPAVTDRVTATDDGRALLEIPPDPRSGATTLVLEPLEWVRRITNQVPASKAHMVRYYGAYANRVMKLYRSEDGEVCVQGGDPEPVSDSQASWARLLRQVFEVDPLACPPVRERDGDRVGHHDPCGDRSDPSARAEDGEGRPLGGSRPARSVGSRRTLTIRGSAGNRAWRGRSVPGGLEQG